MLGAGVEPSHVAEVVVIVTLSKVEYLLAVVGLQVVRDLVWKGLPQPTIIQVLPDHLGEEGEGEGGREGGRRERGREEGGR